jgi:hypothetical protein
MTIHDELVRKLIDLDPVSSKPRGYIIKIIGSANIDPILEELFYWQGSEQQLLNTYVEMSPDIVATNPTSGNTTAIEMETDIDWDFAHSLQQIKKYRRNRGAFQKVVVIIPKRYERFAGLYEKQGFEVHLWKATRIWECVRCGNRMEEEKTVKPKCSSRNCCSTEQILVDLKEKSMDIFKPFEHPTKEE